MPRLYVAPPRKLMQGVFHCLCSVFPFFLQSKNSRVKKRHLLKSSFLQESPIYNNESLADWTTPFTHP